MSPGEMLRHARRRWRVLIDEHRHWDGRTMAIGRSGTFPRLPRAEAAPDELRESLIRDAREIGSGQWRAFGQLKLPVDDPPRWHCDYLAGKDLATELPASRLEHRGLAAGADIKLIWELSRWTQLTRLAMAAYVTNDRAAAERCARWLWDWLDHNPPYRGWNWTSPLEAGLRLVQLTWMDALLAGRFEPGVGDETWAALMGRLLPPHAHYVWRHRSFGSSANNHLLGELTGLIVSTVRWPSLARWGAAIDTLKRRLEHEILAQFAQDGGNREQALNYHLFSFELCWQARMALQAAGRKLKPEAEDRLALAADFYRHVQSEHEPWDYGDSDNALVFPGMIREESAVSEWREWFHRGGGGLALLYWLGDPPTPEVKTECAEVTSEAGAWSIYPESGMGICTSGSWFLRWDLSPLGYLRTAAHGHLDALHVSIWHRGVALVVDPGTGAYYGDSAVRARLAARAAHNGLCLEGGQGPRRLGPFLWSEHHARPSWRVIEADGVTHIRGELRMPDTVLVRTIRQLTEADGWEVTDECVSDKEERFSVLWQFAPGTVHVELGNRRYRLELGNAKVEVEVSEGWSGVEWLECPVSANFRQVTTAPGLRLRGVRGDKPCVLNTRFLACGGA